jgi:hypothetical protein
MLDMSVRHLSRWVLAGLLSTMTMDVGAALVRKMGFTAGVPPALLGRWFASLAHGQLRQQTIVDAPSSRSEMPLALGGHYFIGITLTLAFGALVFVSRARPAPATGIALALGFGLATNLLPWLIMFPAMGFGLFGRAGPPAFMLFRSSFVNHAIFAVGLALSTRALGLMRP